MQPAWMRRYETAMNDAMVKYRVPGAVANIVVNREKVYRQAWGAAAAGDSFASMNGDTVFCVMSVAKSFTATAIMQLAERNAVRLDEPVSAYLPYFRVHDEKYERRPITVRQLLSHTAGFPEHYPIASLQDRNLLKLFREVPAYQALLEAFPEEVLDRIRTREDVTRSFAHAKLLYEPGTGWQYCTDAYVIAADLLEKLSGMTWEHYVRRHVFDVLKLRDTFTDPARLDDENNKTRYYTLGESRLIEMPTPVNRLCAPAGFIYSTANDMTRYLLAHMDETNSALLGKESLAGMQSMVAKREANVGYGLGWRIRTYRSAKIVSHAGGYPGVAIYVSMVPAQGFAVVLFANCDQLPVQALCERVTEDFIDAAK